MRVHCHALYTPQGSVPVFTVAVSSVDWRVGPPPRTSCSVNALAAYDIATYPRRALPTSWCEGKIVARTRAIELAVSSTSKGPQSVGRTLMSHLRSSGNVACRVSPSLPFLHHHHGPARLASSALCRGGVLGAFGEDPPCHWLLACGADRFTAQGYAPAHLLSARAPLLIAHAPLLIAWLACLGLRWHHAHLCPLERLRHWRVRCRPCCCRCRG